MNLLYVFLLLVSSCCAMEDFLGSCYDSELEESCSNIGCTEAFDPVNFFKAPSSSDSFDSSDSSDSSESELNQKGIKLLKLIHEIQDGESEPNSQNKIKVLKSRKKELYDSILEESVYCFKDLDEKDKIEKPQKYFKEYEIDGTGHNVIVLESAGGYFAKHKEVPGNEMQMKDQFLKGNFLADEETISQIKMEIKSRKRKLQEGDFESEIEKSIIMEDISFSKEKKEILVKAFETDVSHFSHVSSIIGSTTFGVARNINIHPVELEHVLDVSSFFELFEKNQYSGRVFSCSQVFHLKQVDKQRFIDFLEEKDCVFLNAAGNDSEPLQMPLIDGRIIPIDHINTDRILTVGSFSMHKNRIARHSNLPGEQTHFLYAPGSKIQGHVIDFKDQKLTSGFYSGTSMATPYAAGIFALLDKSFPRLGMKVIMQAVFDTCICFSNDCSIAGYGLINGIAAYNRLVELYPQELCKG